MENQSKKKYLYGAAVQGIQQFIFESTALREIAESSNIVEHICKEMFAQTVLKSEAPWQFEALKKKYPENIIINAAGNIKFLFDEDEEELCKHVVRTFPQKVMLYVPGITISQAVVELEDGNVESSSIDLLESRLRQQRNFIPRNGSLGLMATLRCRKTGKPAVRWYKDEAIDQATYSKQSNNLQDLCETAFGITLQRQLPYNIEDIEGNKKWIAVIHADGNGLGQVVRAIGHDVEEFRKFSQHLDESTHAAVRETFDKLVEDGKITLVDDGKLQVIPIRPVVIGGDDVTIICRADLALDFVEIFSRKFEEKTKFENLPKLTCCAGVTFTKSNFPFHYAYELAEQLCKVAKEDARKVQEELNTKFIPSCLAFHKVQDSYIESYKDIRTRELLISDSICFANGPYYLDNTSGRWTINELQKNAQKLNHENKNAKNALRQWLSDMAQNQEPKAIQRLERMLSIKSPANSELIKLLTQRRRGNIIPAYDVMSLSAIIKTKE